MRATWYDAHRGIIGASRVAMAVGCGLFVSLLVFVCFNAPVAAAQIQAPTPAPNANPSAPNDPIFEAAKRAFDALTETDRRAVQDALIWASDFSAVTSGSFGKRTFDAILQYQRKHGLPNTGILEQRSQTALIAEAAKLRQSVNFSLQTDARSGVQIALPLKLLDKKTSLPNGSRWDSAGGSYSIEVTSLPAPEQALTALFDRLRRDGPQRKITYKLMRPDWFVLSGDSAGRRFYTRYAQGSVANGSILRGYTWSYAATALLADPLTIAIANSFEPFPGPQPVPPSVAAAPSVPAAPDPSPSSPAASPLPAIEPSAPPKLLATAIVVAAGRLLTTLAPPICPTLTVGLRPARLLRNDPTNGLSLLAVDGLPNPILTARSDHFTADMPVLIVGFFDLTAGQLTVTPADAIKSDSDRAWVLAGLQEGASGSLIFDRNGRWRGSVAAATSVPRKVAGIVPQTKWPVVDADAMVEFLHQAGIGLPVAADTTGPARIAADIASASAASLLEVRCEH
jgi:Putative peptidoglycan binding domain